MARQTRRFAGLWGYGLGAISLFVSSFVVTLLTLLVIINAKPWYEPRYAIPLLGMILGNTMTGIALALDNLTQLAYQQQRGVIEASTSSMCVARTADSILTFKRHESPEQSP